MKLWGGRFQKQASELAERFGESISVDARLYAEDIRGSIAHSRMLAQCGIIPKEDQRQIEHGLLEILSDIERGAVEFDIAQEDIHMNIEHLLTERIGEAAKRLHTARSRNDQVALSFKLYVRGAIAEIRSLLLDLMRLLVRLAHEHRETILPGYTHLQRAQPVTLAFHFLAYFQMFRRDYCRFASALDLSDAMPLGACALSGTSFPTDREFTRELLGFSAVTENAMDSVSDRDFATDFLYCCAMTGIHLSRFCEEFVLWSSKEFDFVELDDALATGSSIMPQKKNPDVAELIRGKTGRLTGNLVSLLTVMKGLPLAYNKDMQEDKSPVFDSADTVAQSLRVFTLLLETSRFKPERMRQACLRGFTNATDVADYLASAGVPFRDSHEIVGRIVLRCIEEGKSIEELELSELRSFSDRFGEDIYEVISLESCIGRKISQGSTGFRSVADQIASAERWLASETESAAPTFGCGPRGSAAPAD